MSSVPKVVVVQPRYGDDVIAASLLAMQNAGCNELHPEKHAVEVVARISNKGSLLTYIFGGLLAESLNLRDEGRATHMAMIHADLSAPDGWLNTLYSIMQERGDVVVSAVVPIKEPKRERTSTAIGCRGDKFAVKRVITTADRLRMPETFSTKDVAEEEDDVLLVNTGLWIADLTHPFWEDFSFGFDDCIRRNPETGRRQAYVSSEDWKMSRDMDAAGVPYSATWRVEVSHYGPSIWNSHEIPASAKAEIHT